MSQRDEIDRLQREIAKLLPADMHPFTALHALTVLSESMRLHLLAQAGTEAGVELVEGMARAEAAVGVAECLAELAQDEKTNVPHGGDA